LVPKFQFDSNPFPYIRIKILNNFVQIPELLTQRKFVSAEFHAHSNAYKPPKTVAPTVLMLE